MDNDEIQMTNVEGIPKSENQMDPHDVVFRRFGFRDFGFFRDSPFVIRISGLAAREPLRSSFLLFCGEEVEFRMASRQARQSRFIGFGDQGAHGLDEGWEIERLFKQRADTRAQRGKKLVGPGGDDDDGQKRVSRGELFKCVPTALHRHVQVEQHQVNVIGRSDS